MAFWEKKMIWWCLHLPLLALDVVGVSLVMPSSSSSSESSSSSSSSSSCSETPDVLSTPSPSSSSLFDCSSSSIIIALRTKMFDCLSDRLRWLAFTALCLLFVAMRSPWTRETKTLPTSILRRPASLPVLVAVAALAVFRPERRR